MNNLNDKTLYEYFIEELTTKTDEWQLNLSKDKADTILKVIEYKNPLCLPKGFLEQSVSSYLSLIVDALWTLTVKETLNYIQYYYDTVEKGIDYFEEGEEI